MAISHRSKKKKKKNQTKKVKGNKIGSFESTGIIFQKVAHTKRNLRTDIHSWPSCIIAGFDDSKQSIFIDYNYSTDTTDQMMKDIHELTGFFGDMQVQDIFTILNASYDDSLGKPTTTIEGNYKLLSYDNGRISAEKQASLDPNFVMKKLNGRNFARPLQYEKESELNSIKKVSSITNWLDDPKFSNLNLQIGDSIEPVGTSFNDYRYVVVDMIEHNDGSEEIKVSPEIDQTENRIGKITKFNIYRNKTNTTIKDANKSTSADVRQETPRGLSSVPRTRSVPRTQPMRNTPPTPPSSGY